MPGFKRKNNHCLYLGAFFRVMQCDVNVLNDGRTTCLDNKAQRHLSSLNNCFVSLRLRAERGGGVKGQLTVTQTEKGRLTDL